MNLPPAGHEPILVRESIDLLAIRPCATVIDATVGRGGHSLAFAQILGQSGTLIGLDVDARNLTFARDRLRPTAAPSSVNVRLFEANFSQIQTVWDEIGQPPIDAILADLGVSTNQLFDEHYGLSFSNPMPLDMRLDPSLPQSAADIVNKMSENDLANVLYELAQERYSRRIARKIVEARATSPIDTTDRLAELVRSAVPSQKRPKYGSGGRIEKIDPATRTFLALRMKVNREIENLEALLERAPKILRPGGRLGVISFQSGEDRMVKQAFRSAEQTGLFKVLTNKPIIPTDQEIAANPRSRSAKLRVLGRSATPG